MTASGNDDAIDRVWVSVQEGIAELAAHEVKDVLNGVALNLEVIRSRTVDVESAQRPAGPFATAAAAQMEILSERAEALLYLMRAPREPADVTRALRHLAALLVPAVKANGGALTVDGLAGGAPTAASARATRLALAAPLLALARVGGVARCHLEAPDDRSATVVRFSHESAAAPVLDPEVADAIGTKSIHVRRSATDLSLVFPGP